MNHRASIGPVHYRSAAVEGVDVFYREAGPDDAPVVLLLHGFPTSSRMFRNLIPALSDAYRVIAPDYPGFGHSAVPDRTEFGYTFDHLADVTDGLLDQLGIEDFALYVMDFGAPVGFRLALRHPERLSAIIAQNAPLYPEKPQGWWATLGRYWADGSASHREASRSYLDRGGTARPVRLRRRGPVADRPGQLGHRQGADRPARRRRDHARPALRHP